MVKYLILQVVGILFAQTFHVTELMTLIMLSVLLLLLLTRLDHIVLPLIIICMMMFRWTAVQIPSIDITNPKGSFTGVVDWVKASKTGNRLKVSTVGDYPFSFIYTDRDNSKVLPGDTLHVNGNLVIPDPPRNPGQFDYGKYLKQKGISYILTKGKIEQIVEGEWSINRQFFEIQNSVRKIINTFVDAPFSGIMTGLILGDRSGIDEELKDRFQEIGVIHILAVSGLHVGYIFMMLSFLASGLNIRGKGQFWIIFAGLVFYAALTGFTTSVLRASLMAIMYSWGKMREKNISTWNIIAAAAVIILAVDPLQLFSPGFVLSFGAVWGILFTYPRLQQLDSHFPKWKEIRKNKVVRGVTNLTMVTIGAQIGTFIPVAVYFRFFPVWGFLSNLFIVFLAGVAVISGILTILSSFLYSGLASIFGHAAWSILWLLNMFSEIIFLLPFRKLPLGGLSILTVIVIFVVLVLWVWSIERKSIGIAAMATLLFWNFQIWSTLFTGDDVKITFLDVGQGDSCIIQDDQITILIDAGYGGFGRDMGQQIILPFLAYEGIKNIDLLIMSHPHSDHIGGISAILESVPVNAIWSTFTDYKSQLNTSNLDLCKSKQIPIEYVNPGEIYQLGKLTLTCLYPTERIGKSARNVNNASIVLRIDHEENSILFVGDMESEGETWVTKIPTINQMDIIKIGHHGSTTSSTDLFCNQVDAKIGIISVGKNNKFRHPSQEIIDRWENQGTQIFRTDQTGAVTVISNGSSFTYSMMLKNGSD
ncbi:MAG: DNA internalization-related competence protein ComEC/Rec2 [Candidatus Marinimicrobia bacterium]|nr:DNA internalization-related competence protein ComEC/Rec2 [Candidatus Neomarinimicrobiota bacterium]